MSDEPKSMRDLVSIPRFLIYRGIHPARKEKLLEKHRAEEELHISEHLCHQGLFENARDVIYLHDLKGRCLAINKAGAQLLGYSRQEILQMQITDFIPVDYLSDVRLRILEKLKAHWHTTCEVEVVTRTGQRIPVEVNSWAIYDNGIPVAIQGIARDITEQKRNEEALRESEERHRELFESSVMGMSITKKDGRLLACNPAFARIFGFESTAEALRSNVLSIYRRLSDWEKHLELLRHLGKLENDEVELQKIDGTPIYVYQNVNGVFDQAGEITAINSQFIDLTQRKSAEAAQIQLENQLRQSQKLEAIGQLAGGVAHDFNNLLTAITGYTDLSLKRLSENDPIRTNLEQVKKASERATSLTRQLLAFSRKQILEPHDLDLNIVISELFKMLSRLIAEDIQLTLRLASNLGSVRADPGQIEQIVVNLVVNARDAMPDGGSITIETANTYLDDAYAQTHLAIKPGHHVMLAISDTGIGMDAETRAHIFEPFFTTKQLGKGTGLGLSTVYGIVKQSEGFIWVYSEPGHGTTFKIYLPRSESESVKNLPKLIESATEGGSGTVLILEDEDVVLKLSQQILKEAGYNVITASQSDEATRLCAEYPQEIDLLLTDVVMPGASGKEVADHLKQLRPTMKVLFMSGYTDEAIVHHGILDSNVEFIQKPFSPNALCKKVREVLTSSTA